MNSRSHSPPSDLVPSTSSRPTRASAQASQSSTSRLASPALSASSTTSTSRKPGVALKIGFAKFLLKTHPAPPGTLLPPGPTNPADESSALSSLDSPSDDSDNITPHSHTLNSSMSHNRRASSRNPPSAADQPAPGSGRTTRRGGSAALLDGDLDPGYGSSHSLPPTRSSSRSHLGVIPDEEAPVAPVMQASTSASGRPVRARAAVLKDSEDDEEEDQDAAHEPDFNGEDDDEEQPKPATTSKGKKPAKVVISDDDEEEDDEPVVLVQTVSSHGRKVTRPARYAGDSGDDEEYDEQPKPSGRRLSRGGRSNKNNNDFVEPDEEYDQDDGGYGTKRSSRLSEKTSRLRKAAKSSRSGSGGGLTKRSSPKPRATRNSRKADASFEGGSESSTSDDEDDEVDLNDDEDEDEDGVPAPRTLRQKNKIDYYTLPPLEAPRGGAGNKKGKQRDRDNPFGGLPANLTGAQWAELYPDKQPQGGDSDSDNDGANFSTPRKAALFSSNAAATAAGFGGAGGMFAGGAGAGTSGMDLSGTPSNLGKVTSGNAALADTDPLGIASTVSFDSVGGLGAHIQQLKEMVSLPLLYPEVFERFNITPPRGVLFHGPPGTGKTLLARALAASCSTEGQKISFFMRKGADCLSKWVGEAERQLRLLFEEAKKCQPSIIFFDEIDGLAPVRSSKQEQIHASIVSTLLALMDGMDGRGQVIVIGATNRPDAIDPALRRPGRFDREFYFPLPNLEGRRKILDIHTNGWNPPIEESFKDELAMLTKGYGGADLRALCTEAALNAVQRTYPQIYKTNERLVIDPKTIDVTARDFIISQKNLIPSTARATSSAAAPIPPQLEPLLTEALEAAKIALTKVLPDVKKANVLEEAEWEDDGGGFEKEKMMQAFETLRVFRPRMLVYGDAGMGQGYVGAAVLHHLEGFHVQTLDLATLVSDSSRTMEAACVQLFVEAKRHKPSILFVPSLVTWCASVTDTVRSTIKGLLDGLDPSDPILLLAVVDGPLSDVPADVRTWFGFVKGNRVNLGSPRIDQRDAFFRDVILGIQRPPSEFPDAMPRRKRILDVLPIAPPPPPKAPTEAEIKELEVNDQRQMEYLKWRLGPLLNELKKRYKRFTRNFYDDWRTDDLAWRREQLENSEALSGLGEQPYHNVDLDTMHLDLYNGVYCTPEDFLGDILRIQSNAEINAHLEKDTENPVRAGQMVNHAKVMLDQTFADAQFRVDCQRMSERMREREKNAPPGAVKPRRKDRSKAVNLDATAIAAAAAAGGGGRYGTRSHKTGREPEAKGPVELEDPTQIERRLKRSRKEGEDSQAEGDDDAPGPSKRPTGANGINGVSHADEGGDAEPHVDADAMDEDLPVASGSGTHSNGNANGVVVPARAASSFADLLNPTVPLPAPIPSAPILPFASISQHVPGEPPAAYALAPPMQVGALPDVSAMEFASPLDAIPDASTLLPLPSGPASLPIGMQGLFSSAPPSTTTSPPFPTEAFAPVASTSNLNTVRFADNVFDRESTPAGPAAPPTQVEEQEEPIVVDPPTPEPLPDFVLPEAQVDAFRNFLRDETDRLNVDQLEQLRAACYDIIWRGRKAWDRTEMLDELEGLTREFVEEVNETCGR